MLCGGSHFEIVIDTTKDRVTRTPLKTGSELKRSGRVSSSCSTSDTRQDFVEERLRLVMLSAIFIVFIPVSKYNSKLIPCFILDNFIDINGALK
jgi:hypothetical protein